MKKKRKKNPIDSITSSAKSFKDGLLSVVVPVGGGYVAARMVGRISRTYLGSKLGKHAAPIGNILATVALHYGAKKWAEDYQTELVSGAAIGAIQSIVQTYMPGLGWLLDSDQVQPALPAPAGEYVETGDDETDVMQLEQRQEKEQGWVNDEVQTSDAEEDEEKLGAWNG